VQEFAVEEPHGQELGLLAFSLEQQVGLPSCFRRVPLLLHRLHVLNAVIKKS
jgi:hypothetical protein